MNNANHSAESFQDMVTRRAEDVRRYVAERRALADGFRAKALGNSIEGAARALRDAEINEAIADGMERGVRILLGQ